MAAQSIRLAILDDYQGVAAEKFSHLSQISVDSFADTLDAKNPEQRAALIKRLEPYEIISTMRERTFLPADVINHLPNLQLLCTTGMKNAAIDMAACANKGIIVAGAAGVGNNTTDPPTSHDATIEHTWALILGIAKHVSECDAEVRNGGWQTSLATGLKKKTLGIIGFGRLGSQVARIGHLAFGMNIIAWSTSLTQEALDKKASDFGLPAGTFKATSSKEELLQESDFVSIHYVLSDRSRGMIGAKELALLKPTAIFINTSRGPLVDEDALYTCLKQGKIRGAALDVFGSEPLPKDSVWRANWGRAHGSSEVLISPHMGYAEEGAIIRWYEDTANTVAKWLAGETITTKIN